MRGSSLQQAIARREEVWKMKFEANFPLALIWRDTTPLEKYRPWLLNVVPWLCNNYAAFDWVRWTCGNAYAMLGDDPVVLDLFLRSPFRVSYDGDLNHALQISLLYGNSKHVLRLLDAGASLGPRKPKGEIELDDMVVINCYVLRQNRLFTRATCIALLSLHWKVSPAGGHVFRQCVPRDILRLIAGMVWAERFNLDEKKKQ